MSPRRRRRQRPPCSATPPRAARSRSSPAHCFRARTRHGWPRCAGATTYRRRIALFTLSRPVGTTGPAPPQRLCTPELARLGARRRPDATHGQRPVCVPARLRQPFRDRGDVSSPIDVRAALACSSPMRSARGQPRHAPARAEQPTEVQVRPIRGARTCARTPTRINRLNARAGHRRVVRHSALGGADEVRGRLRPGSRAARLTKLRSSWLYRIRPSVAHQGFQSLPDNPDVSPIMPVVSARGSCSPAPRSSSTTSRRSTRACT
jgi:hypothetical protein